MRLFWVALLLSLLTAIPALAGDPPQGYFIFQPIAKRPNPTDFSKFGGVSAELNTALRDYQTKPSMETMIGVLQFFTSDFYAMTTEQRDALFKADHELFLSMDMAKYEIVMHVRERMPGAKKARRCGSSGLRELELIKWVKGDPEKGIPPRDPRNVPGLDPQKQGTSDDDVTILTESADFLDDEKVNGSYAEDMFKKITREWTDGRSELDPHKVQVEFLSPTKAWGIFQDNHLQSARHKSELPIGPPESLYTRTAADKEPDFLYAWTASNPEKYNDPFGVYMLDVWGYDKGVYTEDVGDPMHSTKLLSEVRERPANAPVHGMFAYIGNNYRQIFIVHHGRFESECKYLVRMIDAWEAVQGKENIPPSWQIYRKRAEAVYKKGAQLPWASDFQSQIPDVITEVVVQAHSFQMDRVADALLAAAKSVKNKETLMDALARGNLEDFPDLAREMDGLLVAYTNVPEDVHERLMEQFRERIQKDEASKERLDIFKSEIFKRIMEVVQKETAFQRGNIEAFRRIRALVSSNFSESFEATDLDRFLEQVARGKFTLSRLRLDGLRIVREERTLDPQEVQRDIEFINAAAEIFLWSDKEYAAKVKEYIDSGPDVGIKILQKISQLFDSSEAAPASVSYKNKDGETTSQKVVPSGLAHGLTLFKLATKGGEYWGHIQNGKDLYENLRKLFYVGGMKDEEIGQAQAALFANAINFQNLVAPEKWRVPASGVLTSNTMGTLASSAGAVRIDSAANDALLYSVLKDLVVMYNPHLAGAILLFDLAQWGYKQYLITGSQNNIIRAMLENGVWDPADFRGLKQLKSGELPKLRKIRDKEGGTPYDVVSLARIELAKMKLIVSKTDFNPRETLLNLGFDGDYIPSDPVVAASIDALNNLSGSWGWRTLHLGILPKSPRNWTFESALNMGIVINHAEDDRRKPMKAEEVRVNRARTSLANLYFLEPDKVSDTQLRMIGFLMGDFWTKQQKILEEALLPSLEKEAARQYYAKLKEEEALANNFNYLAQVEEIYAQVKEIDKKLWPRIARSAEPFSGASYDPEKNTPILDAFKADPGIRGRVNELKELQDFLRSALRKEADIFDVPSAGMIHFDRKLAPRRAGELTTALLQFAYKFKDGYDQIHALLDEGKTLVKGNVVADPFHVGFDPGAAALGALPSEGFTPVRGDLATARKWVAGYKDARRKVFNDIAEKAKAAPPDSFLDLLGQKVLKLMNRDIVDSSDSPDHPSYPKMLRLRYQIRMLQTMQQFVTPMEAKELQAAVTPMVIHEGVHPNPQDWEASSVSSRSRFIDRTIAEMEAEYKKLLDGLTALFQVDVRVQPDSSPYLGQEVKLTAIPKLDKDNKEKLAANGFPQYAVAFRWVMKDANGNVVNGSETTSPSLNLFFTKAGVSRIELAVLDRGGNTVAKNDTTQVRALPLSLVGNIVIQGDYEGQPITITAGGDKRGQVTEPGPFKFELREYDERVWVLGDSDAQASTVVEGKSFASKNSIVIPQVEKGEIAVKDDLLLELPYNVNVKVDVTDHAGLPVAATTTIRVQGSARAQGSSATLKLEPGASVSAHVSFTPLQLEQDSPAVVFQPEEGRTLQLKAELAMFDTGHLVISGQFVPGPAMKPQPQLTGGQVATNFGDAAVDNAGAFRFTNSGPIDLRSASQLQLRAIVTDANRKLYRPKEDPFSRALGDATQWDLGAIPVQAGGFTVRPIQAQLFDWTGRAVPATDGQVLIGSSAATNQGGTFVGEYTFSTEDEEVIIEGGYQMPDGQLSIVQAKLSARQVGGWQNPQPPPLYSFKLPFYLPGSLQLAGTTRVQVPQGGDAPALVTLEDTDHGISTQVKPNGPFSFALPVAVQVNENVSLQASAQGGALNYRGSVAAKAPTEGSSLDLGEVLLTTTDVPPKQDCQSDLDRAGQLLDAANLDDAMTLINDLGRRGCDVNALVQRYMQASTAFRGAANAVTSAMASCDFDSGIQALTALLQSYPASQWAQDSLTKLQAWQGTRTAVQADLSKAQAAANPQDAQQWLGEARSFTGGLPCLDAMVDAAAASIAANPPPPPPPTRSGDTVSQDQNQSAKPSNPNADSNAGDAGGGGGRSSSSSSQQGTKPAKVESLSGDCKGTIEASRVEGFDGEATLITVKITGPWHSRISQVRVKANGKESPPANKVGDGIFERAARFTGRDEWFEVWFIAMDDKGEQRCAGSIQLHAKGPRRP